MSKIFENLIVKNELKKIKDIFFNSTTVAIEEEKSGQYLDDKNAIVLGCRAGPTNHVEFLCHEMAHFVELEEKRLLNRPKNNWDFKYGTYYEIGHHSGCEAKTYQSVLREMRCWALQYSLMKELNIGFCILNENETDLYNLVKSVKYIECFYLYKIDKINDEQINHFDRENLAIKHLEKEVLELTKLYNFEYFLTNWRKRISLLEKNYVEG